MKLTTALKLTLLSVASMATQPSAALENHAQQELRDYYFAAARNGDELLVQEFIRADVDLNTRNHKGYTALMIAAYHGHQSIVEQLLNAGANACAQDQRGNTALMAATFKGELGIAYRLLNTDCPADIDNHAGQTALMFATLFDRAELIDALVTRGANIQHEDHAGNRAVDVAISQGNSLRAQQLNNLSKQQASSITEKP
jgi:ankyrin repeat protein